MLQEESTTMTKTLTKKLLKEVPKINEDDIRRVSLFIQCNKDYLLDSLDYFYFKNEEDFYRWFAPNISPYEAKFILGEPSVAFKNVIEIKDGFLYFFIDTKKAEDSVLDEIKERLLSVSFKEDGHLIYSKDSNCPKTLTEPDAEKIAEVIMNLNYEVDLVNIYFAYEKKELFNIVMYNEEPWIIKKTEMDDILSYDTVIQSCEDNNLYYYIN